MSRLRTCLALCSVVAAGVFILPYPGQGRIDAAITAPNTIVSPCSESGLRAAMGAATAQAGSVISFSSDCSITLTAPLTLTAPANIAIDGGGHHVLLDGGATTQIFVVPSNAALTISRLLVEHGSAYNAGGVIPTSAFGGAINNAGTLRIVDSTFANNSATGQNGTDGLAAGGGGGGIGGAIYSAGSSSSLLIANSTFAQNSATGGIGGGNGGYSSCYGSGGGGLYGGAGGSCFSAAGNGGFGSGGGGGSIGQASGSGGFGGGAGGAYSGNGAGQPGVGGGGAGVYGGGGGGGIGGALFVDGSVVSIVNSTIAANTATGGRGGYSCYSGGPIPCPFTGWDAAAGTGLGGGAYISGTVTMWNTIIAGNSQSSPGGDLGGTPTSQGTNNIVGVQTGLGPLQDNGGPTITMVPLPGSLAVAAGNPAVCQAHPVNGLDQRGDPRPVHSCDSGAVDTDSRVLQLVVTAPSMITAGQPFSVNVSVQNAAATPVSLYTGTVTLSSSATISNVVVAGPYQFTTGASGDNGSHTFSGVVLRTAGSQIITATESGSSSGTVTRSGTTTLVVQAAATATPTTTPTTTPTSTPTSTATSTSTATPVAALAVHPISATVGQTLSLTGSGFASGESVSLMVDTAGGPALGTVSTTLQGSFTVTATVPVLPYGPHTLIAQGQNSGRTATTGLAITPLLLLRPNVAAAGTSGVAVLLGFGATETVLLHWDSPTGPAAQSAVTTSKGSSLAPFVVPAGAPQGRHIVYAVGQLSHAVGGALFTVVAPSSATPSPTTTSGSLPPTSFLLRAEEVRYIGS